MNDSPKLLLFISIDVVGSTAYKNSTSEDRSEAHPWLPVLYYFFSEFPAIFAEKNDNNKASIEPIGFSRPKVWKYLGDEIVFVIELTHCSHLNFYLGNVIEAMDSFVSTRFKDKKLGLKGAAWIAGFPVANVEIEIKDNDRTIFDYLGRSMDAGFRLSRIATSQKFILSVQTAWMLAKESGKLRIYYDGRENLKGIKNGDQYPIFWISSDKNHATELDLLQIKASENTTIAKFCKEYILENGWGLPFIEGDHKFSKYKEKDYSVKFAKAASLFESRLQDDMDSTDLTASTSVSTAKGEEFIVAAKEQAASNRKKRKRGSKH